jgi:hypothetical protein
MAYTPLPPWMIAESEAIDARENLKMMYPNLREGDRKPWLIDSEEEALYYHRSEMQNMDNLLTTYQYCDCEKSEEVLAAIQLIRDSLNNRN